MPKKKISKEEAKKMFPTTSNAEQIANRRFPQPVAAIASRPKGTPASSNISLVGKSDEEKKKISLANAIEGQIRAEKEIADFKTAAEEKIYSETPEGKKAAEQQGKAEAAAKLIGQTPQPQVQQPAPIATPQPEQKKGFGDNQIVQTIAGDLFKTGNPFSRTLPSGNTVAGGIAPFGIGAAAAPVVSIPEQIAGKVAASSKVTKLAYAAAAFIGIGTPAAIGGKIVQERRQDVKQIRVNAAESRKNIGLIITAVNKGLYANDPEKAVEDYNREMANIERDEEILFKYNKTFIGKQLSEAGDELETIYGFKKRKDIYDRYLFDALNAPNPLTQVSTADVVGVQQ
jgi:hypothetical protein